MRELGNHVNKVRFFVTKDHDNLSDALAEAALEVARHESQGGLFRVMSEYDIEDGTHHILMFEEGW